MSAPPQDLSALLRQTHLTSHEEVLKAANSALKESKSDLTLQLTRVVALLKLERFDDALRAFDEGGSGLKQAAQLEYAYALYKAGEFETAAAIADKLGQKDRGMLHVAAQTTYRLEKFEKARHIYQQLASSRQAVNEEIDLRINRTAVDAQLEWSGRGYLIKNKMPQGEDLEAFETAFNTACASIARGDLKQAEILLNRAKELCFASVDLSDEQKRNELLPIIIQQVYVMSKQGYQKESVKICESVTVDSVSEPSIRQTARVNILSCIPQNNPFLAHRVLHSMEELPKNDRLFEYQSAILRQNQYALDLLCLKFPGVARSTATQLLSHSGASTSTAMNILSVLNAAAHARNGTGNQALKLILPLLEKRPHDVGLLLTIIQLYVLTNNLMSAITVLESFLNRLDHSSNPSDQDVRYAPGLVCITVSLYAQQGRHSHAKAALAAAAAYWMSKQNISDNGDCDGVSGGGGRQADASLLRTAGTWLLKSGDVTDAVVARDIFANLRERDAGDRVAAAGLVASLAVCDSDQLDTSLLNELIPTTELVADVDVAALENAGIPRLINSIAPCSGKKRVAPVSEANRRDKRMTRRKKKLIRGRMPEDLVPEEELDPERWLPLRDRSYWKPKGKKGKARRAGLTQGGVIGEREKATEQPKDWGPGTGASRQTKKKKGKRSK